MARVLCVGSAVVDMVFSVPEIPRTAEKHIASDAKIVGGGIAANAAVAVARLGGHAVLAARLGEDGIGQMIVEDLRNEGVDCAAVAWSETGRSSFSSVFVDAAGERQIVNFRGAGLSDDAAPLDQVAAPDAVLADTRWPVGALHAFGRAMRLGIPAILDAEAPVDPRLVEAATHVAFSRSGLEAFAGPGDPAARVAELARTGKWIAVTDGAKGTWWAQGASHGHVPAFSVDVVDTLGAGDVWHGAFALALAERMEESRAAVFASAAAALKCRAFGGRTACPGRDEVLALMAREGRTA